VVIIGGGFGGLAVAKALKRAKVLVTLVDRRNHHLFTPLLYQVAMAGLSPAEIAVPIRSVLASQKDARVLLSEVTAIDFREQRVTLREAPPLPYDYLVIATGSKNSYFGHDDWEAVAPGLKDVDDALEIRRRVLLAFEAAERAPSPDLTRKNLTFVVIGGGPTGVELAGAIAELASFVLACDFRAIDPQATRVVLVEGGERILSSFAPELSERAVRSLRNMGVEVRTGTRVTGIDANGVSIGAERLEAGTVLWAAGVRAATSESVFPAPRDAAGRVIVEQDCSVPGQPRVFCVGDAARFVPAGSEQPLPGVSPVAIQQGRFVARQIQRLIAGQPTQAFAYYDKGSMATIGRSSAVVELGRIKLSGFFAWLFWLIVHIYYLIDFRNRLVVLIDWAYAYLKYERGARLITGREVLGGPRLSANAPREIEARTPPPSTRPGVPAGDGGAARP
jgi:NADH dehydrogenase